MKKSNLKYIRLSLFVALALISASCQKVIHLDLSGDEQKLVIEALMADTINGGIVRITKTVDFYSPTVPQAVSGAQVQISEEGGTTTTLSETVLPIENVATMVYLSQDVVSKHDKTYKLTVTVEGKTYTAQSRILTPVAIDSIKFLKNERPNAGKASWVPHCYFKDPAGVENFYRLKIKVISPASNTESTTDRFYLRNDKFFDGKENDFAFQGFDTKKGDVVEVELISLDNGTYEYFRTLSNIVSSGGGMNSSSPANPNSNINNGALGYFAAQAISKMRVTVP